MKTQKALTIIFLVTILTIPAALAGFMDIWNSITGKASFGDASVSLTIGNEGPVITWVGSLGSPIVTESNVTYLDCTFQANDNDGYTNLQDSSAACRFNLTGEAVRSNTTCNSVMHNATAKNYTCAVGVWYWDAPGLWTINVSISDINGNSTSNASTNFNLQQLGAIVIYPANISWNSINPGQTAVASVNNPITINNTGNFNITSNIMNITAYNLRGLITTTEYFNVSNMSVNIIASAGGNVLADNTKVIITGATLPRGNLSLGSGTAQEQLYFYIEKVPVVSSQTYNATAPWRIAIPN